MLYRTVYIQYTVYFLVNLSFYEYKFLIFINIYIYHIKAKNLKIKINKTN